MEINMLEEGLKFMVLGMSTVFGFLLFMVFFLKLQGRLILKYASKDEQQVNRPSQASSAQSKNNMLAAVLSAAIMHHKKVK